MERTSENIVSGFDAMGKPVPYFRRQAAYDFLCDLGIKEPMTLIDSMSHSLSKDRPFLALETATKYVDLTGAYRLIAILLATPPKECNRD